MSNGVFRTLVVAVSLSVVSIVGCGGETGPKLVKVTGKVTIGGKPAQSATIIFQPVGEGTVASATIGDDGTYDLVTQERFGAIPGSYKVEIVCMQQGSYDPDAGQKPPLPCNVPPKYGTADSSGLTADVKDPQEGPIDFELK